MSTTCSLCSKGAEFSLDMRMQNIPLSRYGADKSISGSFCKQHLFQILDEFKDSIPGNKNG